MKTDRLHRCMGAVVDAKPDVKKILLRSLGCIPKMRLLCW